MIYYILYQLSTWIYTAMKYRLLQVKSPVDVALEPNEMCCWGIQHVIQAQWWYHEEKKNDVRILHQ